MVTSILITGGAGFIGSHLADQLLACGYRVRVLDNLCEQVHGPGRRRPDYLHPDVELMVGDVCDPAAVRTALEGVQAVFHFAAAVGVGQSMYQVEHYVRTNCTGTGVLLEALIERPVRRLIVASSMSVYGEGLYLGPQREFVQECSRSVQQLQEGQWELADAQGNLLQPVPTPESKKPSLSSVYALTKFDQEQLCLMIGRAYRIPTTALRFFNVYGTRQALSNPYTGVLAIFASRLLNDRPPLIFEDGYQQRDFVSVHDVARACRLAMETPEAAEQTINIASGNRYTVRELAEVLAATLGKGHIQPQITRQYRTGDIRHCFADLSLARRLLGFQPQVALDEGLAELARWLQTQVACDLVSKARAELEQRGLAI